ncbi:MAG: pyridoxal 5'-phosphate synthase glutaminase subunit PdxT [Candidatus Sabulitectum sp.]|nr:pyridoxal 5'-phosphate synthase glutaminase subunit PdxT [Candidatus Sabulitectum sp.]
MKARIGVLALQGGVSEHVDMLNSLGCTTVEVRLPEHLADINGLVIPGGESTALIKLLLRWNLVSPIRELAGTGIPIWGTCAGSILLSDEISEKDHIIDQPSLELVPVRAERNSFGRQVASFQEDLVIKGLDQPFPGVFIRAPLLYPLSNRVEVLCTVEEGAVFLKCENIWLSSFHPELTDDTRIHRMFIEEAVIGS